MISADTAIQIKDLGKSYLRSGNNLSLLVSQLLGMRWGDEFQALANIDLTIKSGESVGIIGPNGAGKSTLLQIIGGVLAPTRGTVRTSGRIVAMLELGAGFNPDFTGRENVYLCAASYGLKNHKIESRMDAIREFADIGPYFDRPVQEYSSGMFARLAFAVCAHVDADILIVDEILGVGDVSFQRKCREFMRQFREFGTLLFVSHDAEIVGAVCERAIWLENGLLVEDGNSSDVIANYTDKIFGTTGRRDLPGSRVDSEISSQTGDRTQWLDPLWKHSNKMMVADFDPNSARYGHGGCTIIDCWYESVKGKRLATLVGGKLVRFKIKVRADQDISTVIAGFIFRDDHGTNLFGDNTYLAHKDKPLSFEAGDEFTAIMEFPMPYLPDGTYFVAPSIIQGTQQIHIPIDWREEALILIVADSPVVCGKIGLAMDSVQISTAVQS